MSEDDLNINTNLYSRQIGVYGLETMIHLSMKKVFTTLLASVMAMAALAQATTDSNGIIVEKPEGTLYDNLYWNSEYSFLLEIKSGATFF